MAARPHSAVAAKAARQAAPVMVGVLAGLAVGLSDDLPSWRRLTPLALWTSIDLRNTARTEILRSVAAVLDRQSMPARQLILLGEGVAARRALELVLQGALVCAGILAIDVPCTSLPFRIVPTAAAVRLVVRHDGCESVSNDLLGALRASDIDERIIRLNPAGAHDARAAASAAETFVLELVATVVRHARHGVRTDDFKAS